MAHEYPIIARMLKESGERGLTCHEIAAKLGVEPKQIGKALMRMRHSLHHLKTERNGQRIVVWAGEETHG